MMMTARLRDALGECARANARGVCFWWREASMRELSRLGLVEAWTPPSVKERPRLKKRPWIVTPAGRAALEQGS